MTNPIDRERIARKVAEELGWKIEPCGDNQFRLLGTTASAAGITRIRYASKEEFKLFDALIDARCRILELEAALGNLDLYLGFDTPWDEYSSFGSYDGINKAMADARLALHEKEPKP